MGSSRGDLTLEKMNRILNANTPLLLSMIRIKEMFIALLVQHGAIPSAESENVRAIEQPDKAKQYLLDIIKSKVETFLSFCIVLHQDKRDDIVRGMFKLNISQLKRQKKKIEDNRKKEEDENRSEEEEEEEEEDEEDEEEEEEQARGTNQAATTDGPVRGATSSRSGRGKRRQSSSSVSPEAPASKVSKRDGPVRGATSTHSGYRKRLRSSSASPEAPAKKVSKRVAYKKLTYKDVVRLLTDHKTEFFGRFEPTLRVLAELKSAGVITADTENTLKASGITPDEKKNEILNTVEKKGVEAFLDFCLVLCQDNIGQKHMVTEVLELNIDDIRKQRYG